MGPALAQKAPLTDANTPLHALQPDYLTPYREVSPQEVKGVLDRVRAYLEAVTPTQVVDRATAAVITDRKKPVQNAALQAGDFRLTSYEWGVTYGAMLLAGQVTGDKRYTDYTAARMKFLSEVTPYFRAYQQKYPNEQNPLRQMLSPHALDDAGAMCMAMIKAERAGVGGNLRPQIDLYMDYIMNKEYRLADGTLARNRPLPNTLWLDDLYMSVPAIAQMGKLTGDTKYYDEAVKQVRQFSQRMFNREKGVYMHGWVESMETHPQFHWGRANGWALMTKVELLEVLPENHPGRAEVLALLKAHIRGLASYQSGEGFWHQLLDRNDSYLETSATAIYAYCIAHAINRGWIDRQAHASMALLAWNAVSTKVNEKGQVEGTCVGTGMAFDPAFYYYRPISPYAAHGYGPVLLAGAAMYQLLQEHPNKMNDSAMMFPN
ncbi:Rhamnogalacturonyl hydrolase YesR [Catalinimonas alkaloidigena]|uniref:Rhamnogalacturonyl hydrolase YesR n=2 Tax=Catalinimonas alkaloidigena TaxID=1075417 RepID=A0A1G9SJA4_9BACT|nr:glycoside hydrolase family 88 protein [Catalinimonas alkaloidigena]SDM35563.1 Rhamnogalacturonyl hydrolase YesR [Catalinimonas alkaloidigena]